VSVIEEDQKNGMPYKRKRRQERASAPRKRKSIGKKAKESGKGRSSAPYKGKGTAREVEKKFMGNVEKEG